LQWANGSKGSSQADVAVDGKRDLLLGAEITLRGLDRGVAEQKLDLFNIPATLAAEFRACTVQIVRPEIFDPDIPS
jgi:hypothetical protein